MSVRSGGRGVGHASRIPASASGGTPAPTPTPTPTPTTYILPILAGQSNHPGRNRVSTDPNGTTASPVDPNPELSYTHPRIREFGGDPTYGNYRTLSYDIVEPHHPDGLQSGYQRVGPGLNILYGIAAENAAYEVVAVPCAVGSTGILNGGWLSNATPGAGGVRFENMITQANLAIAAIVAADPTAIVIPRLYWIQGEQDGAEGRDGTLYKNALSDIIDRARARVTGATNMDVILGSMVPRKFTPSAPSGYVAGYVPINQAHVDLSVDKPGVRYILGPDNTIPSTNAAYGLPGGATVDGLHYQTQIAAREFGTRIGTAMVDTTGPSVTNAASQGNFVSTALVINLGHDDPLGHATFHITGGADAAQFEISDRYNSPKLRWAGNGSGPAVGTYVVEVKARDGMRNYGPAKTFSVEVVAAYGVGDQGPVTLTSVYMEEAYTVPTNGFTRTFNIKKGKNLFFFAASSGGNRDSTFAVTINGNAATKHIGNASGNNLQVWSFDSPMDQTVTMAVTFSGSGGVFNLLFAVLTGSKVAPTSTDFTVWASGASPHASASMTVPANALTVMLAAFGSSSITGAGSGTTQVAIGGTNNRLGLFSRSTTGAPSFTSGATGFRGFASLVFEKST